MEAGQVLVAAVLAAVGVGVGGFGAALALELWRFTAAARSTTGRVVAYDSGTTVSTDAEGERESSTSFPAGRGRAEIATFRELWWAPAMLLATGAIFVAVAIAVPLFDVPVGR